MIIEAKRVPSGWRGIVRDDARKEIFIGNVMPDESSAKKQAWSGYEKMIKQNGRYNPNSEQAAG